MRDACANLYKSLITLSIPCTVVDEMELWQIAAYTNADEEPGPSTSASDRLRARYEAYKRGEQDPAEMEPSSELNPEFVTLLAAAPLG